MSILLVTYIRKSRSSFQTSVHPYTRTPKPCSEYFSIKSLKPKKYTTLGPLVNYFISLYSKKTKMSIFLVTYIRKNSIKLSNIRTPIHTYSKSLQWIMSKKAKTYTTLCPLAKYFIFLYRKKLKISIFLVTYIRRNSFELSNIRTPIHPYTKTL